MQKVTPWFWFKLKIGQAGEFTYSYKKIQTQRILKAFDEYILVNH